MKLHFLLAIFLFITTSSSNALSCIDVDESIQISISKDFTLGAVQEAIDNLLLVNGYDECLVEIKFNYSNQSIQISFSIAFQSSNLKTNQEVRVDFLMSLAEDKTIFKPAKIVQFVEFACDYEDGCDRRFVLDHLEWLFNANYDELESAIRPFLIGDNDNTGKNDVKLS